MTQRDKTLEGANIKLASVISDVTGKTGLAILRAMAAGEEEPEALVSLAVGTLKGKHDTLLPAVQGDLGAHQRFMLTSLLNHLDFLALEITKLDEQVAERLERCAELITRLDEIPGVGRRGTEEIIAEIGADMTRFSNAANLVSWARMCPGNNESGGKRHAESIGPGNKWLRSALVEAALGASRTKKSIYARSITAWQAARVENERQWQSRTASWSSSTT